MSAISVAQSSFTGGEFTPELWSRTDLQKYGTATKRMRNFHPHPHGGASNRGGTDYIVRTKDSKLTRVVQFQFSVTQGYGLVFSDQNLRFIKDGLLITQASQAITAITKANPAVVTYVGADTYANGDRVIISGVLGMTEVNNREFTVANVNTGANTFELSGVNSTGYTTYSSAGSVSEIYEISTPYLEADLALLKFEQSADVAYITHPSYQQMKLTRTAHTSWTLSAISFAASIAAPTGLSMAGTGRFFAVSSIDANGLESLPSAQKEGAIANALTWVAATGAVEYNVYEVISGTYQFVAHVVGTTWSPGTSVVPDPGTTAPAAYNPFNTTNSYPGCSCFYDQRLIFARTNSFPQTFWGTVIGDFENMNKSSPIKDDDSFQFTINSGQVNEIRWMSSLENCIIGTSGGIYRLYPGGTAQTLTPTSANNRLVSKVGANNTQPILVDTALVYVEASSKNVRDLSYSLTAGSQGGYGGNDLSILAQHLLSVYGITEWCYQRHPDSIMWCIREDGKIVGMTYNKEQAINGWHLHETDGSFESICCVTNTDDVPDILVVVKRTVNGATVRNIEKFHPRDFVDIEDAFFVDSGLTYDGSVSATLTPGTGATTLASTGVTFTAGSASFVAGDVGREIHYRYATADLDENDNPILLLAVATITGYTSTTVVTATINAVFPSTSLIASGKWRMSVTTITSLNHLIGESVVALANGNVIKDLTVSSGGNITLPNPASKIQIGLGYTGQLQNLAFDFPTKSGTVQDRLRYIVSIVARLKNTRSCFAGADVDHLREIKLRKNENYLQPTSLFNGDKELFIEPPGDPRGGSIFIQVDDPVPITVQALYARISYGEK